MKDIILDQIIKKALACFENELNIYGARCFPKNCCEEVSSILLNILEKEGYISFKLIKGTNDKNEHHFWLESGTNIIDLTAHQFQGIDQPFLMVNKNDYPLIKIFSTDIASQPISTNWTYLIELLPKISQIFYSNYYNLTIKHKNK